VTFQWWLYGVIINDGFVAYPNFFCCLLSAIQLSLFLIYPSKSSYGKKNSLEEVSLL